MTKDLNGFYKNRSYLKSHINTEDQRKLDVGDQQYAKKPVYENQLPDYMRTIPNDSKLLSNKTIAGETGTL